MSASLIEAQVKIFESRQVSTIFDVGTHHGDTAIEYLDRSQSDIQAFEADTENHSVAQQKLAQQYSSENASPYGEDLSCQREQPSRHAYKG